MSIEAITDEKYHCLYKYAHLIQPPARKLIGREHELKKIKAAMMRPELCNVMLLAEPGSGKACADGTLVPVADDRGYVPIEDIKVGDYVFDEKGQPTEVLGVFPQGLKDAYRVTFGDYSTVICNNEHLWTVRTATSDYHTCTLFDIYSRGITGLNDRAKWFIPANGAVERETYTGDISDLIVAGRVSQDVFMGSIEQRKSWLRDIVNSSLKHDSECLDDLFYSEIFCTDSHALACDVKSLAASVGLHAYILDNTSTHEMLESVYRDTMQSMGFSIDEDASETDRNFLYEVGFIKFGYTDTLPIIKVEDLETQVPMTCLYVAADSHLFQVTENHIVTHNTMLVQSTMKNDVDRLYLEIDLSKMIANCSTDVNQMAAKLKSLFDDTARYVKEEKQEVVLFIDEFHQVVQLSDAAVEALKPLLADSGARGIRVIAATTPVEFRRHISPNQPLVERLQRINLPQTDKATTIEILRGMAERYGVADQLYNDSIYEAIYEYTNRYIPANAQPRKSILILDAMIGWYKSEGRKLDKYLLADVIYDSEGVNVAFKVDASKIKARLDKKVLSQQFATTVLEQRLQLCVADLNNKGRPMSSLLFSGSSGSGKGLWDEELVPVYESDGSVHKKRNGDLVVGDYVFNRKGEPVQVTGVYHRGLKDVYRVTLSDGRSVIVDGSHLWTWLYSHGHKNEGYVTTNTEDLIRRGLVRNERNGFKSHPIRIPMNQAVQYPEQHYVLDPYVVGAFIGDGCLTIKDELTLSSGNSFIPDKIANLIGAVKAKQRHKNYNWVFVESVGKSFRGGSYDNVFTRDEVFGSVPELCGLKCYEKYIPEQYKYGSVEQRWRLIQGLFDTDGTIGMFDGERFNVSYTTTSLQLAKDIQEVLFSLGFASSIVNNGNRDDTKNHDEYQMHVSADNCDKIKFFTLPKKVERAKKASETIKNRKHDYANVAIVSIEKLDKQLPTTCIMVDDDEHLYQCGQFIVTHNTEMAKQLAEILFDDDRSLLRMDMTEYANSESLERFRRELTARAWEHPHSIILLDEIEKACSPVTRLLLQVLDDGRLIDENNREVSFTNAYIIMTTNAGSEIYQTIAQYAADDDGSGKSMKRYDKLIRNSISTTTGDNRFPPELLGRIDAIVPFQPLSEQTMKNIARMKLQQLRKTLLDKHGVKVAIQEAVIRYLVEDNLDTDSNSGGARTVVSKLESEVTTKIAKFINENPGVYNIRVMVEGTLAADDEHKLLSDAYIKVVPVM